MLFASVVRAEVLGKVAQRSPQKVALYADEVTTLNRAALAEMQTLLLEMRPESILRASFFTLLENLCRGLQGRKLMRMELDWQGLKELYLSADAHITFYRLAQEALSNVIRHSEATQLTVRCGYHGGFFTLVIQDNGKGFDLKSGSMGFGLNTMRERARHVGGKFNLWSSPGEGTRIEVTWAGQAFAG
ncbi:MAG: hypothetical protein HC915_15140 [Anaerolineae bacterium]|nr:hypothetical protein [Anaerolineae bacterium]